MGPAPRTEYLPARVETLPSSRPPAEVRSQLVGPLLAYLRATGRDPTPLVERFGLPANAASLPEVSLPLTTLHAFLDAAETLSGDAFLGLHVAQRVPRGTYGLVEYIARASATVRDTFRAYNLVMLVLAALAWAGIARTLALEDRFRWLGFCLLFFNFACLKMPFYNPVLTDTTALALAALLVHFHLRDAAAGMFAVLALGAFTALALLVLAIGIMAVGGERGFLSGRAGYRVTFPATQGLIVGSPVQMSGVQIGSVSAIHLPTDPRAPGIRVELTVDDAYEARIREGSTAALRFLAILSGEKFVEVTPGDPAAPGRSDVESRHP